MYVLVIYTVCENPCMWVYHSEDRRDLEAILLSHWGWSVTTSYFIV